MCDLRRQKCELKFGVGDPRCVQEALESRQAGRTMTRWVTNILMGRNIHMPYQGESVEAKAEKVCLEYYHTFYFVWQSTVCSPQVIGGKYMQIV